MNFLVRLFATEGMPHGYCYLWDPGLVSLHVISDSLIALAYTSIPFTLVYFVRKRRDLAFSWMFICFGMFIIACGFTHVMEIWTLWHASYWLSGTVKAVTAMASVPTAVLLVQLMPKALAIPSPNALRQEILQRKRAEDEIRNLNQQLEQRAAQLEAANLELEQRSAELEATNKELEAFTYSVSHDLRAPLRHIDGFSKMLVDGYSTEMPEPAREYVSLICDSAHEMGRLVDDLLHLAHLGRTDLRLQVTGLNSLVDDIAEDLKRANPARLIQWKIGKLPFTECDPGLMKQVFVNLLSNAVKFTSPREQAVITVDATQENGQTIIFVRDNGVGFNMRNADKLFGVFQRLHRQEDFEGTGVGLATIQRIIHKHGGRVWAQAELNKGATFFFTVGQG